MQAARMTASRAQRYTPRAKAKAETTAKTKTETEVRSRDQNPAAAVRAIGGISSGSTVDAGDAASPCRRM
jgi:hypothetical protein